MKVQGKYAKVYDLFWEDPQLEAVSPDACLLALYLLTGPERNAIGCARIGLGALTDRPVFANIGRDRLQAAFAELQEIRFVIRDDTSGWTLIRNALKYDPVPGPKQAVHAFKLALGVPRHTSVWRPLMDRLVPQLRAQERYLSDQPGWPIESTPERVSDTLSERVSDGHPVGIHGVSENRVSDRVSDRVSHTVSDRVSGSAEKPAGTASLDAGKPLKNNGILSEEGCSGNRVSDTVSERVSDTVSGSYATLNLNLNHNLNTPQPPSGGVSATALAAAAPEKCVGDQDDDAEGFWSAYQEILKITGVGSRTSDLGYLKAWIAAGIDLHRHALPAIREWLAARNGAPSQPVSSIAYFKPIIVGWMQDQEAKRGAADAAALPMGPHGKRYKDGKMGPGDLLEPSTARRIVKVWLDQGGLPEQWPLTWWTQPGTKTPLPGEDGCPVEDAVIAEFRERIDAAAKAVAERAAAARARVRSAIGIEAAHGQ